MPLPPASASPALARWRWPALEVRHGERAVDRGVERDGDDHRGDDHRGGGSRDERRARCAPSASRTSLSAPAGPAGRRPGTRRAARCPSSRSPDQISTRPTTCPRCDRQRERRSARPPARTSGRPGPHDEPQRPRRDERERAAPVRQLRLGVGARRGSIASTMRYCERPHASSVCRSALRCVRDGLPRIVT